MGALWAVLLVMLAVTYTRLDPVELYNVSNDGIAGGLSRVLVEVNFPVALVALATSLIALDVLGGRWWWLGGPAIGLCALTAWPGVVDDGDLDARLVNALPAAGVVLAIVLTVAAVRRVGAAPSGLRRYDGIRVFVAVAVIALSLPWIAADLGFFLPDGVFITERPYTGSDGGTSAAVHLGHHHGLDGALLVVTALALSRARLRAPRLGAVTTGYVALMLAYGAVIFTEDLLHEQLEKRGSIDWRIPSALTPSVSTVWLVIVLVAAALAFVVRHEQAARRAG